LRFSFEEDKRFAAGLGRLFRSGFCDGGQRFQTVTNCHALIASGSKALGFLNMANSL
jgi:hypothetical protein